MSSLERAAPMKDVPGDAALLERHGRQLLALARASIACRLATGRALACDARAHPPELRAERAVFVTLSEAGRLRGCIGTPLAWRPLVVDVADNAAAAAMEDRRFHPLAANELAGVAIALSLLSPPEPLSAASETALLAQLVPGTDGLILEADARTALFLPQVWQHLPQPRDFLAELKAKAGLPRDRWSPSFAFRRFTSTSVVEVGA
ncbi:MAG: AmmeMemoRadiSam system protein A [Alphaproteobacteria bacterium]